MALARAMVGKPAIYPLDEATSAPDQENSEHVEALATLYDGCFVMTYGVLREG